MNNLNKIWLLQKVDKKEISFDEFKKLNLKDVINKPYLLQFKINKKAIYFATNDECHNRCVDAGLKSKDFTAIIEAFDTMISAEHRPLIDKTMEEIILLCTADKFFPGFKEHDSYQFYTNDNKLRFGDRS